MRSLAERAADRPPSVSMTRHGRACHLPSSRPLRGATGILGSGRANRIEARDEVRNPTGKRDRASRVSRSLAGMLPSLREGYAYPALGLKNVSGLFSRFCSRLFCHLRCLYLPIRPANPLFSFSFPILSTYVIASSFIIQSTTSYSHSIYLKDILKPICSCLFSCIDQLIYRNPLKTLAYSYLPIEFLHSQ